MGSGGCVLIFAADLGGALIRGELFFLMMGHRDNRSIQQTADQNDKADKQHYLSHLSGGFFTHISPGHAGFLCYTRAPCQREGADTLPRSCLGMAGD